MSNTRIVELESAVSELQSTVRGLTEELVESKERIRTLEAELEEANAEATHQFERTDEAEADDVAQATAEADKKGERAETDETKPELGEIIVA